MTFVLVLIMLVLRLFFPAFQLPMCTSCSRFASSLTAPVAVLPSPAATCRTSAVHRPRARPIARAIEVITGLNIHTRKRKRSPATSVRRAGTCALPRGSAYAYLQTHRRTVKGWTLWQSIGTLFPTCAPSRHKVDTRLGGLGMKHVTWHRELTAALVQ